jgi:RNA polymerase sigma-70 factor (family 1)
MATTIVDQLTLLINGDQKAFEAIYDHFSDRLYRYVYSRVRIKETCEEIVQEIFVSLWSKRESLEITNSLESYLYGAAKHKILSHIRSTGVREKYAADFTRFTAERVDNSSEELLELKDLQHTIDESISELPEKCQRAFRMSRMEHETIQRIAERMNISTRTVENYISLALRHLRTSLGNLLGVIILVLYGR